MVFRLFLPSIAFTACTHHKSITEAHEVDGTVQIETTNGAVIEAEAVGGSTRHKSYVAKDGSGVVPDSAIARIKDTSHGRGALEGLGFGALVGATLGAAIGYADGDDTCDSEGPSFCVLSWTAEQKAAIGAVGLGLFGGAIGLVAGAITGSTTIYENKATQTAVRAVAPAGSQVGVTVDF